MKFLNLTPHPITIIDGNYEITLPVDGPAPRLAVDRVELGTIVADHYPVSRMGDAELGAFQCAIVRSTMGEPIGLPEPQDGVVLVVSALVAEHPSLSHRTDLAYPGEAVRDDEGRIVGCRGLCAGLGLADKLRQQKEAPETR